MIRRKPLGKIVKELEFGDGGREYKPGKPGDIPPQRPIRPGKPKPRPDFGKVLGQQPITMGEDYKKEIDTIRPIGNGSAMRNQYRAQGGGRFK
jgi:hypothetical protein